MSATGAPKSTSTMLSDITGHVSSLVRNEADLARAGLAENLSKFGGSLGTMALAVALGIAGFNLVAASLVALAVWAGLPPDWATFAVAAALIVIAMIIFFSAKSALYQINVVPHRSAQSVQRDAAVIKDTLNDQ